MDDTDKPQPKLEEYPEQIERLRADIAWLAIMMAGTAHQLGHAVDDAGKAELADLIKKAMDIMRDHKVDPDTARRSAYYMTPTIKEPQPLPVRPYFKTRKGPKPL